MISDKPGRKTGVKLKEIIQTRVGRVIIVKILHLKQQGSLKWKLRGKETKNTILQRIIGEKITHFRTRKEVSLIDRRYPV
jgi:hypothetical protein